MNYPVPGYPGSRYYPVLEPGTVTSLSLPVADTGSGKIKPVDLKVGSLRVVRERQQADRGKLLPAHSGHQVVEEVCVTSKVAAGVWPVTHLDSNTLLEVFFLILRIKDEFVLL